ncbi:MAG TPA: hypothetical protein VGJ20_33085 [Xanthobacteraceae bacterium]|jgi:hypothetical protein
MAKAKLVEFELESCQPYPNPDAILAAVEKDRGADSALYAASHFLDAAVDYLVRKRGAEYMLDRFSFSVRITDALCNDMRRTPCPSDASSNY